MDQALADLIKISRTVGRDSSLVQGGGGNTSVKTADGKHMYIKASGTAIKDLDESRGWRRLRLADVREILCDPRLAGCDETRREKEIAARLTLCCEDAMAEGARPSVESHLHATLDRCVAHLHPVAVGAYVCARQGRAAFEKLFERDERPPLWIPYADPGYALAKAVARRVDRYAREHGRKPSMIVLAKHGLFVTGDTADAVLREIHRRSHAPAAEAVGDQGAPAATREGGGGQAGDPVRLVRGDGGARAGAPLPRSRHRRLHPAK